MAKKKGEAKEEILKRLKEEYDLDSSAFSDTLKRIKNEIRYTLGTAGDHWNEDDDQNRGVNRPKCAVPLLNNKILKAVSRFEASPYGIVVDTDLQDEVAKAKAKMRQYLIRGIESRDKAVTIYSNALKHAFACGYGYWYATTKSINGKTVAGLELIDDPRCVVFGRDARKPDGSNASIAYYTTTMSMNEAKRKYGESIVDAHGSAWMPNAKYLERSKDVNCVYVWEMEYTGQKPVCKFYKIVCNKIVDEGTMQVRSLPIFRVAGNTAITKDSPTFIGKAHNAIGAQRMVDYMASMSLERLARTPLPAYVASDDAIADDPMSWDGANKDSVSVRRFKAFDDQGRPLPPPMREDDTLRITELTQGITAYGQFLNEVIGSDESASVPNQTAEEALIKEQNKERSDSEIYSHLEDAIVACGYVLNDLLDDTLVSPRKMPADDGSGLQNVMVSPEEIAGVDIEITVEAGVMRKTEKKERLGKALAMAPMLGADSKLVWGAIAENVDDLPENVVSAMKQASEQHAKLIAGGAGVDTNAMAQQMAQAQEQMSQMQMSLDQANNYIQQQDAKIFALEQDSKAQVLIKQMDIEGKIFIERIKQAGNDQRLQAEIEAEKEKMMAQYLAELQKASEAPKTEIIDGYKPAYNAVGGLRNKPLGN